MKSEILSVTIDCLRVNEIMDKVRSFLITDNLHQIVTVNPEFIMCAQKDNDFRNILNSADLSIPDGVGLQWAAKYLRQPLCQRISGVDLTWEISKIAAENHKSIFLLGGKKGVAEQTAQRLKIVYPQLKVAGTYAGTPDEEGIVAKINQSRADILLVAYGAPKQDKFIYNNKNKLTVKLAMGVGGTFDYISGAVPRAPRFMRSIGLEWLYRLIRQPSRVGRIFTATVRFPVAVIWSKFIK